MWYDEPSEAVRVGDDSIAFIHKRVEAPFYGPRGTNRSTVAAPTVAWPSEAVRVGDDSIASIHKRVEAPFYGPRGAPDPIKAQTQNPGGLG